MLYTKTNTENIFNYIKGLIMKMNYKKTNSFLRWNNKIETLLLSVVLLFMAVIYGNAAIIYQDSMANSTISSTSGLGNWQSATTFSDAYTILEGTGSVTTAEWGFNTTYKNPYFYVGTSSGYGNPADDWLITPGIYLQSGITYHLTYYISGTIVGTGTINLAPYIGDDNTIAAMTTSIAVAGNFSGRTTGATNESDTATISVTTSGLYYIGFHNTSTASPGQVNITMRGVKIEGEGLDSIWAVPYYYGWEDTDIDPDHFDDYWLIEDGNGNGESWYKEYINYAADNEYSAMLQYTAWGEGPQDDYMVTPAIAIDERHPTRIDFSYGVYFTGYEEKLKVYLKKDTTQNIDTTYAIKIADLNEFQNTSFVKHTAFVDINEYTSTGFPTQGFYYLVFYSDTDENQDNIFVDSVSFSPAERAAISALVVPVHPDSNNNGTVYPPGLQMTYVGTILPIDIRPDRGYHVASMFIGGVPVTNFSKTGGIYNHLVTGSTAIEVTFALAPSYTPPYFYDMDSVVVGGIKLTKDPIDHAIDEFKPIQLGQNAYYDIFNSTTYGAGNYLRHNEVSTSSSTITDDWLFSPVLDLDTNQNYMIRFSARTYSASTSYLRNLKVYFALNRHIIDTVACLLDTTLGGATGTTYSKYAVPLTSAMLKSPGIHPIPKFHFAFRINNSTYTSQAIYIDSLEVVQVSTVSFTASATNGSVSPTSMSGLMGGSVYQFALTPDVGYWLGSVTVNDVPLTGFSKIADTIAITLPTSGSATIVFNFVERPSYMPYSYGFETADNSNPNHFAEEWKVIDANDDGIIWIRHNEGSNYCARMSTYTPYGGQPQNDILISPPINMPTNENTIKVTYKYKANSSSLTENVKVVLTREASQTGSLGGLVIANHMPMDNTSYLVKDTLLTPSQVASLGTTGKLFLKFHCFSDADKWYPYIDSIRVDTMPNPTVTVNVGPNGSVSPGTTSTYYGGTITYTITPATGYMIESINIDGTSIEDPTNTYVFTNLTSNRTMQVTFKKLPRFIAATIEAGVGVITPSGNVEVEYGDSLQFTFTPSYGYKFDSLKVNNTITTPIGGNTYTFTNITDSIQSIKVYFSKIVYNVNVTYGSNGSIAPSGLLTIEYLDTIDFTITPAGDDDYEIDRLYIDNVPVSIAPDATSYSLVVTKALDVHIIFRRITYSVTASVTGNGSVSPSGTTYVNKDADVEYTFIPMNMYYEVSQVLLNGEEVDKSEYADNTFTVRNIRNAYSLDVSFAPIVYTLTTSATGGGSIDPLGVGTYFKGEEIYITLTPDNVIKELHALIINGEEIEYHDSVYHIGFIDKDYNIEAIFDDKSFIINAIVDGGGTMSPVGNVRVYINHDQVFNFDPWEGFEIDYVRVNGKIIETDGTTYRFRNVTANGSIYVYFKQKDPTALLIKSGTDGNGTIFPKGGVAVTEGLNQTFTFEPSYGYLLDKVYISGVATNITGTSYTFTNVQDTTSIYVTFKKITYSVSVQTDCIGGAITPSGNLTLPFQSTEVFKFIPDEEYILDSVFVNGQHTTIFGNMYPVYVTENLVITAKFIMDEGDRTIVATAGANGTIDPIGNVIVPYQTDQVFTFIPEPGYKVDVVLADGISVDPTEYPNNKYTFTNVEKHHTIHVTFIELPTYIITATSDNNGAIDPSGTIIKYEGDNQLFTFTGISTYVVDTVWVNDEVVGTGKDFTEYNMTNIVQDMTIHVIFVDGTGIAEDENKIISIFPNPTTSIVSLQGDISEFNKVEVLNLAGSVVLEFYNIPIQLDISKLSNGTYTIRFIGKNRVEDHSIVKIK
jgi:hypothetical protein